MDDFLTGPYNFSLYIDSSDISSLRTPHEGMISIMLAKPLEFTSGTWEVCLKQLIFQPKVTIKGIVGESNIFIKRVDTGQIYSFSLKTTDENEFSLIDLINHFNS